MLPYSHASLVSQQLRDHDICPSPSGVVSAVITSKRGSLWTDDLEPGRKDSHRMSTTQEEHRLIEPLRIYKRRSSPIKLCRPPKVLASDMASDSFENYGQTLPIKPVSPFKAVLHFPNPPRRAQSGLLSFRFECTNQIRTSNTDCANNEAEIEKKIKRTREEFSIAQRTTRAHAADLSTLAESKSVLEGTQCSAVRGSSDRTGHVQEHPHEPAVQESSITAWLYSVEDMQGREMHEAVMRDPSPLSESLRNSLRVVGAELPHTVALLDRLNGNPCQTKIVTHTETTETSNTRPREGGTRERVTSAPLPARNTMLEMHSQKSCSQESSLRNHSALSSNSTGLRRRNTARTSSTFSDHKFTDLMTRISDSRASTRVSASIHHGSSRKLHETLRRPRAATHHQQWRPHVSLSVRDGPEHQTYKQSCDERTDLLRMLSQTRTREPAQGADTSSRRYIPWIGSYRRKPIEKIRIPACFV